MEKSQKLATLIGIVVTVIIILSAILITIILLEPNGDVEPGIAINPPEVTESILKGTTKQVTLSATVVGQIVQEEGSTTVPSYEWSIDNDAVATLTAVDNEATLVLKAGGKAVVTVTYGELTKTCNINVTELVAQITLNKTKINEVLEGGTTKEIKLTATPHNIPELTEQSGNSAAKLKWESSNTKVAVIEADGNVANITIKGKGKTVITATYKDLSAQCEINVIEVDIKQSTVNMNKGKTTTLTISEYTPKGEITWESSNTKIATVNAKGVVTGVTAGTATITLKHIDTGITDTCTINVSDLKINQNSVTINKGKTTKITLGKNAPKGITWSSSNSKVATVSSTGVVTGKAGGTVTITAKSSVTGAKDTCVVNVKAVEIVGPSLNLRTRDTIKLSLSKYAPSGTIKWSSSNTKLATVDNNGVVTGINIGMVKITAEHTATGLKGTYSLKVWETVDIKPINSNVYIGERKIQMSVLSTSPDGKYIWNSSNSKVATVDNNGLVTLHGKGETVIGVEFTGGSGLNDECSINVYGINIKQEYINGTLGEKIKLTLDNNTNAASAIWKTSNPKAAIVDKNGNVTCVGIGTAMITVELFGTTDSCVIGVSGWENL